MSSVVITVNDVLEELNDENKRLETELMFANKCFKLLVEFKVNFDLHSNKIKAVLVPEEWQEFEQLGHRIQRAFSEYHGLCDASRKKRDIGVTRVAPIDRPVTKKVTKSVKSYAPVESEDSCPQTDIETEVQTQDIKPKITLSKMTTDGQQRIIRRRNPEKLLECTWPGCLYKTTKRHRIRTHMNEHKGIKPFACEHDGCDKAFISNERLKDHQKRHTDKIYSFICDYEGCGKKFNKRHDYGRHKNLHFRYISFECKECPDKWFPSKINLQKHIDVVHKVLDQPLICTIDECNREFKTAMSFRIHQSVQHLSGKQFVCDEPDCQYKSPFKKSLIRHKRSVHTKEKPFACQIPGCSKTFSDNGYLLTHVKSCHTSGRNFHCTHNGCQKTYKTKNDLNKHIANAHLGVRFPCDWPGCEHQSTSISALKTHKLIHVGERNFQCQWPECGKAFKKNSSLQEHIRTHTNDKPFACTWPGCSYRCSSSANLCKHIKIHKNR